MASWFVPIKNVMNKPYISDSNIWQFTLKMQLARFLIGGLSTVWKATHAYSLNGVHLILSLQNSIRFGLVCTY